MMLRYITTGLTATVLFLSGCGGTTSSTKHFSNTSGGSGNVSDKGVDVRSFKIKYKDADHIYLTWDPVEGADGYSVNLARDMMTVNFTFPYDVEKPIFNVGDKVGEGTWWIKVKANGTRIGAVTSFTITSDGAYIDE